MYVQFTASAQAAELEHIGQATCSGSTEKYRNNSGDAPVAFLLLSLNRYVPSGSTWFLENSIRARYGQWYGREFGLGGPRDDRVRC